MIECLLQQPLLLFYKPNKKIMAKKQKISVTTKSQALKITHPDTAGIDVGKTLMQVSVPEDRSEESNRNFGAFTKDLREIVKWLGACGIKRVVMESTGIYWVPLFLMLEEGGFDAILVDAKAVKNMSGRKTDVGDADWLRFLGSCDLISPCHQIASVARRLREYHRLRAAKVRDASRELQHMQKAMEKMNIKLDSAISDIAGKSGMSIIRAILAGERDSAVLASLADDRCRNSRETIASALEGTWDTEHILSLRMAVETYDHLLSQIRRIDGETEIFLDSHQLSETVVTASDLDEDKRAGKAKRYKNPVKFDVELHSFLMFGVNLLRIPGVGEGTLMTLMAELGPGFTRKFSTPAKFCRWCNLTPSDNITGGRIISSKVPKRPNPVGQALRQSAITLRNSKSPMGQYFRRMSSRLGPAQAVVATAHKISEIVYLMVERQVEYDEKRTAVSEKEIVMKRIKLLEKKLVKLKSEECSSN